MPEAITITVGPAKYRVYQHVAGSLAQLTLSGTWDTTGTLPDAIEYRVHTGATPGPWLVPGTTAISPSGSWEIYTASIAAGPAQATGSDRYKIEVRSLAGGIQLATHLWANEFGMGYGNKWAANTVVDNVGMPLEPLALPVQIQPVEP